MNNEPNKCILPDGTFCTICCQLEFAELLTDGTYVDNSVYQPCSYCSRTKGCSVHEIRPATCREFDCHNIDEGTLRTLYEIARYRNLPTSNLPQEP